MLILSWGKDHTVGRWDIPATELLKYIHVGIVLHPLIHWQIMPGCEKPIPSDVDHVQTGQSQHGSIKSDAQTNPVINITLSKNCQAKKNVRLCKK